MSAGEWKSGGREEVAEETVTAMLSRSLEASVRISARPGAKETSIRDQLIFPLGDNDGILAEKWDWECKQSNGAASRNERLIGVDEASIPEEFKVYTGVRQSPVAIDSTVALPWMFPPLQLHHHWEKKASIKLTNTGHSVEMSFLADDGCCPSSAMPYLIGGPLAAEYEFVQMHFHWGNENHVGCEHIIDNKKYAMEAHLVHYNRSYGSVAEAFKHPDGLAVIGIFLQVGESENEGLSMLSSRVKDVCDEKGKCALVNPCDAAPLFWVKGVVEAHFAKSATGRGGYYTYLGSLTTPNYDENVTWIVFPEPSPISKRQVIPEATDLISSSNRYNRSEEREYNVLVIGVPNVGKSSLINWLRNRHLKKASAARVGGVAGVTRSVQNRIKVSEEPKVYLLDTPGVLQPTIKNVEAGLKLALCACLQDHLVGEEVIADYLLYTLNNQQNFRYVDLMGLAGPCDDISMVLVKGAIKMNKFQTVKQFDGSLVKKPNVTSAAVFLIREFREGRLGKIILDPIHSDAVEL